MAAGEGLKRDELDIIASWWDAAQVEVQPGPLSESPTDPTPVTAAASPGPSSSPVVPPAPSAAPSAAPAAAPPPSADAAVDVPELPELPPEAWSAIISLVASGRCALGDGP